MGWFFGGLLHLAVNDRGERLSCCLTAGNVDDRTPVPHLVKRLRGKLCGDRGYISAPLTQLLFEQGLQLITRLRKNMKNHLMHLSDKLRLAQTGDHRSDYRPAQEYFANRAFPSSEFHQFCGPFDCRARCLQSSRQKTRLASR